MKSYVGTIVKGAGSTTTLNLGFEPAAMILYSVGGTVNDVATAYLDVMYGLYGAGIGQGSRLTSRYYYRADGVNGQTYRGGVAGKFQGGLGYGFSLVPNAGTGFTVTWNAGTPTGWTANFLAIGGDDVRAYVAPQPLLLTNAALNLGSVVTHDVGLPWTPTTAVSIGSFDLLPDFTAKGIALGFSDTEKRQHSMYTSGYNSGNPANRGITQNTFMNAGATFRIGLTKYIPGGAVYTVLQDTAGEPRNISGDILYINGPLANLGIIVHGSTGVTQNFATTFKPQAVMLAGVGEYPLFTGSVAKGNVGAYSKDAGVARASSMAWLDSPQGDTFLYHKGVNRSDLAHFTSDTSATSSEVRAFSSWLATADINPSGANWAMAWKGASSRAYYLLAMSFQTANKFEGIIDFTSEMSAPKIGGNRALNGSIEAAMAFDVTQLGGLGNLDAQPMDMQFSLQTPGIGFTRPLEGVIESTSDFTSRGVGFTRPLEGVIDAAFTIEAPKIGREWSNTGSIDAAFSLEVPGIGFSRPLTGIIPIVSDLNGYFILDMPTVRPPTRDDLIGTVNLVLNPSVELGLLGWKGVGATPTQSQESAWDKSYSAKYALTAAGKGFAVESITGLELTGWARDPVSGAEIEGTPRRMPSQVRLRVAGSPTAFSLTTLATYQDLTSDESDPLDVTVTGDWKAYYPPTVDLDPDKRLIKLEIVGVAASACTLYADGAQIEEDRGQGPTSWVTGAYGRESGVWTGGPNQSMSVRQPIPMIVRGIGRGGAATIKGTMYRVTQDNVILDDISDLVIEARASMDVGRRSTWQLDCTMSTRAWEYMRPNEDWLAPWLRIEYPNGEVKEGQLGLYFVTPSSMTRGEFGGKVSVFAGDPLWLLDREEFVGSQAFPALTDHSEAIRQMIAGGIMPDGSGFRRFYIPDSGIQMAQAFEWEDGTSRLAGSLELCEGGAMYPLWTDPTGFITTKRMGSWRLRDQTPVKGYLAHIPDGVVVDPWIPRVAALKSEVVGEVSVTPKAQDYVDRILVTSADPRLATPIETQAMLVYADAPIEGLVDSMDDPSNPVVYQEWWRQNQARGRDGRRRQGSRQGRRRMKSLPYVGVGRSQTLPSRLITSPVAAKELAATLVDNLSSQVERVGFSVFPDPSIDYAHATVVCNIWDAFEDAVAVGQYVVNRVNFGFTPKTAMQTMELSWVDPNESEIVLR